MVSDIQRKYVSDCIISILNMQPEIFDLERNFGFFYAFEVLHDNYATNIDSSGISEEFKIDINTAIAFGLSATISPSSVTIDYLRFLNKSINSINEIEDLLKYLRNIVYSVYKNINDFTL